MRGLILRRKTGTVSVEVFTFHVHLAFERHPETELVHQLRGLRHLRGTNETCIILIFDYCAS